MRLFVFNSNSSAFRIFCFRLLPQPITSFHLFDSNPSPPLPNHVATPSQYRLQLQQLFKLLQKLSHRLFFGFPRYGSPRSVLVLSDFATITFKNQLESPSLSLSVSLHSSSTTILQPLLQFFKDNPVRSLLVSLFTLTSSSHQRKGGMEFARDYKTISYTLAC